MASKVIVLITGGNAGVGYEIIKKLASEQPETHHILMGTRSIAKGEAAMKTLGSPSNVTPLALDVLSDESIDAAAETIASTYGRLDILINNAGVAGKALGLVNNTDFPSGLTLRSVYEHVYQTNTISPAVLTEKFTPLLQKSSLPKVIFITSQLGSISLLSTDYPLIPLPWYNSSKSALNYLTAYYARKYPDWKVNACCPGYVKTGLSDTTPVNESTDPKHGAINAVRLVLEGKDGATGTYSNKEGLIDW